MKYRTLPAAAAAVLLAAGVGAAPAFAADRSSIVRVAPPGSAPRGLTYPEWGARFWQWALSYPRRTSPDLARGHIRCGRGQLGDVWMLPGTVYPVTRRSCEVPAGTALLLPVGGGECSTVEPPPFHGGNYRQLRACIEKFHFTDLSATIDGSQVPHLGRYRKLTPEFRWVLPRGLVPGAKPGTIAHSVGRQAVLFLQPMPVGRHTLRTSETITGFGTIAVSYVIDVRSR